MTKALHVIARQEGIAPKGLSPTGNENEHQSGCWVKLGTTPKQLVGGWLYLHESSKTPSKMGGVVSDVVLCDREDAVITHGMAFIFVASAKAIGIDWRGVGVGRGHGGFVDGNLPHES